MPRSHETQITIDAPLEEVWIGLTDAQQLARWFAPRITVEPGVGGRIVSHWGPKTDWPTSIEIWEPGKHLRLAENRDRMISPVERRMSPCRLVEDFYLEFVDGKTVVRLVHSGFGDDDDWDLEYDSSRALWFSCLFRLQHALERHRGEEVLNGMETMLVRGASRRDVLSRFEALALPGCEVVYRKPHHLGALLTEHHGAILTVSTQPTEGGTLLYFGYLFFGAGRESAGEVVNAVRGDFRMSGTVHRG